MTKRELMLLSFNRILDRRLMPKDELLERIRVKVDHGEVSADDVQSILRRMYPITIDDDGKEIDTMPVIEFHVADPAMTVEERVEHLEEVVLINEGVVVDE